MKKHAYLIIANNKYDQLSFLIGLLDNVRNDFYIMIDRKSDFSEKDKRKIVLLAQESKVKFVDRVSIFWGTYTQVEAELLLFEEAYKSATNYSYYHLFSGVDLPLVPTEKILAFFDDHPGRVFLTNAKNSNDVRARVKYKYRWLKYTQKSGYSKLTSTFYGMLRKVDLAFQKILRVDYCKDLQLGYASNWVSLDDDTVKLLLNNKAWIHDTFQYSVLCDELFIPTLLNKYPEYRKKVYYTRPVIDDPEEFQGNLRYINWWDGSPYTWTDNDIPKLEKGIELGHLFSRKFNLANSPKLKAFIEEITTD
ncbi:beta-1,6-N-acetylglucosaminyltransferase [Limosilactobacillus oris]|uniref:beta-1,6-N-acetylglucosaminyltransferase n=1 Tax=Limosilactobacillus oris TaxID=1632 RepID=UPI0024B976E7|nr:beta-1,6-N-acetylglucosaminyltransferase [Limosilactobacillus oris]